MDQIYSKFELNNPAMGNETIAEKLGVTVRHTAFYLDGTAVGYRQDRDLIMISSGRSDIIEKARAIARQVRD